MGIDICLVETLDHAVLVDMLLLSCPTCKDKGEGGGQVHCKDPVVEEGGREEATEDFKVDEAAIIRGGGEGGKSVDRGTVANVLYGGDDLLDRAKWCPMVNNDGDGCWAHPDKASYLVRGVEEGSAKVMEIVEDGDLPCAVCHKEKAVGLIELCHFFVKVCFEIDCAGETGNVPDAGLVHRGEQVE